MSSLLAVLVSMTSGRCFFICSSSGAAEGKDGRWGGRAIAEHEGYPSMESPDTYGITVRAVELLSGNFPTMRNTVATLPEH